MRDGGHLRMQGSDDDRETPERDAGVEHPVRERRRELAARRYARSLAHDPVDQLVRMREVPGLGLRRDALAVLVPGVDTVAIECHVACDVPCLGKRLEIAPGDVPEARTLDLGRPV